MTIDEMIAVLQAAKEGKAIQFQPLDGREEWDDLIPPIKWDFRHLRFRVKPEPRTIWVNEYPFSFHAFGCQESAKHNVTYESQKPVRIAVPYREVVE